MSSHGAGPGTVVPTIVLVGMMGCGKTAVGGLLAQRLARPLVDVDALVEAAAGRPVAEIFAAEGEEGFRSREAAAVAQAAARAQAEALVIACGGGTVVDPGNVSALRGCGTVVWLSVSPAVAAERLGSDAGRPVLGEMSGSLVERLARLTAERAEAYGTAAHLTIDADGPAAQVAEALVAALADGASAGGAAEDRRAGVNRAGAGSRP